MKSPRIVSAQTIDDLTLIVKFTNNELRPGLSILLPVDLSKNILDSLAPAFFNTCFCISNDCSEVDTRA